MDVDMVMMERNEALEQLGDYRAQLRRRADAEYEAVIAGLEALAKGTPILSLSAAIEGGGYDQNGRPLLAIARADAHEVRFQQGYTDRRAAFEADGGARRRNGRWVDALRREVSLPTPYDRGIRFQQRWQTVIGYALVPLIPAHVRQAERFAAKDCFILWEVEEWADHAHQVTPDIDPYLLRHVHGDIYAVLAEWDLTDLERLVMAGRRRA